MPNSTEFTEFPDFSLPDGESVSQFRFYTRSHMLGRRRCWVSLCLCEVWLLGLLVAFEAGHRIVELLFWIFAVVLSCDAVSHSLFRCSMLSWRQCWCRRLFLWLALISACVVEGVLLLAVLEQLFSLLHLLFHFQRCPCDWAPIRSWIRGSVFDVRRSSRLWRML